MARKKKAEPVSLTELVESQMAAVAADHEQMAAESQAQVDEYVARSEAGGVPAAKRPF
ncbi:hypothetical protein E3_1505 [Rhodococcus phage E3]|uniref:hypothetical protein n=1 Tax=Rhodococcus phage E3 TaxID=1007869 RepID=UPI0002C6A879|nr:hypothetical protein M176_gp159 [Rhodococcus phage E3]AEQ21067.1 hypothetical protein E3_1505 [Rhodococcus phage E3]